MFGALASLDLAWSLADVTMGLMTICNLIAISLLSRQAFLLLQDYVAQKKAGIKSPVFDKNKIPELKDKAQCGDQTNVLKYDKKQDDKLLHSGHDDMDLYGKSSR